jgi:hypothetical protein
MESSVFIGLIKGETIEKMGPDGKKRVQERGKIARHLLELAEQQIFPVVISSLTIAGRSPIFVLPNAFERSASHFSSVQKAFPVAFKMLPV